MEILPANIRENQRIRYHYHSPSYETRSDALGVRVGFEIVSHTPFPEKTIKVVGYTRTKSLTWIDGNGYRPRQ